MIDAVILKGGFNIDIDDSKVTPTRYGVFIPFDLSGGTRMRLLKILLEEFYFEPGDSFPDNLLHPGLEDAADKRLLELMEQQTSVLARKLEAREH